MNTTPSNKQQSVQVLGTWGQHPMTPTRSSLTLLVLPAFAAMLSGCAAIEGIFKAGLWVGIIAVVALVAIIGGAVALIRR